MNKSHKIKIRLSEDGVEEAIREIKAYRDDFQNKMMWFISSLAKEGIPVIEENVNKAGYTYDSKHIESGSDTEYKSKLILTKSNNNPYKMKGKLTVAGKDILFIEFGSGVYYNGEAGTSPHELGEQFGYTIGSYGRGLGKHVVWAYRDDANNTVLSHGTKATQPLYKAAKVMREKVLDIAKEVFGDG